MYTNSAAHLAYLEAGDKGAYIDQWLLAVTPLGSLGTIAASQNFLVKATTNPIPEPTTTMLFALGAVGFAGIARRRVSSK